MSIPLVVSLFSGGGGLSWGFAVAGLSPGLAVEIDGDAVVTYQKNVSAEVIRADIGSEADRIIRAAEKRKTRAGVFAVIGGPPCQGFSTAGSRDHCDPRNRLVFSYLDIVDRLRPSWFLFENVEGILTSGGGDAIVGLAQKFTELGYAFRVEKVNFAQWGLPQARKRVLVVGNRHGVDFSLPYPSHSFDGKKHRSARGSESITVGDAISGLPAEPSRSLSEAVEYATCTPLTAYDALMRTTPPGPRGHTVVAYDRDAERIKLLKPGQSLKDLPEAFWPASFRSRAYRRVADGLPTEKRGGAPAGIRRLVADHASLTITSFSPRELIHPEYDRPLSLRECARLQSFPDAYNFFGGAQAVATQIGNAFPPLVANILGKWIETTDSAAGGDCSSLGSGVTPGLIGYCLTEANGMSPALQATDERIRALTISSGRTTMPPRKRPKAQQDPLFEPITYLRLCPEDRKTIADGRSLGPITMSDRELARLVAVVLRDLDSSSLIPLWARDIPDGNYFSIPLPWFTRDEARPFDFGQFFVACCDAIENFRVIFRCITNLHRRRRKFDVILRQQPLPTMDQIARRGLLEYGGIPVDALASWLTWRKWVYDVDNRSAQETGYLFEPMLTESLGGRSVSAKAPPVARADAPDKRRQVACTVEIGGVRYAYEFKDRITIAASGQGRFAEELSFPRDCAASGYTPALMVMDPTPNDKLTAITAAFQAVGGSVYLGDEVWDHLTALSGRQIATFVKRYIKDPVASIAVRERELHDLGLRYRSGPDGDTIEITVGSHHWVIPRPRRDEAVALDDDEAPDLNEP
jgi:DNA (cytosine-5)-methyltransferase 1